MAEELTPEQLAEVTRFGIHPEINWQWWSTATITMEHSAEDRARIWVQSDGVILSVDQGTYLRMNTQDMRDLGETLIEGANVLESRAPARPQSARVT